VCGRDDELRVLRDAFDWAAAGQGCVVFITGEPGIGKSRLVRELAAEARDPGALTSVGRAVPAGSGIPYRPLTEALLRILRDRPLPRTPSWRPGFPRSGRSCPASARRTRSAPRKPPSLPRWPAGRR
jgi:predicted ATPase